jgi:hypothetical protein
MQEEVEDALDRKDSTGRFAHGPRTLLSGLPRKKGFRRPKFRRYSTNARLLQGWLTKDPPTLSLQGEGLRYRNFACSARVRFW